MTREQRPVAEIGGDADRFFANPPWRGGVPRYRVGLLSISPDQWLPDAIEADEIVRKRQLYETRFADVIAVQEGIDGHVDQLVQTLGAYLVGQGRPTPDYAELAPMARCALWVPDDLCLMVSERGRYRLAAASLCSPSYWRLREKLGQDLWGLHQGHAGLNNVLGERMREVLERLPMDRVLERRNWFLHGPGKLFEPEARRLTQVSDLAAHTVRTERQTLRRLNDHCVAFSIRVRLLPLAGIRWYPEAAEDLGRTIRRLTPVELEAFSLRDRIPELLAFLDQVAHLKGER